MNGQISYRRIYPQADYLQLDICGLSATEAVSRYLGYGRNIPVVLHGDWEKKGCSANSLLADTRQNEYIKTAQLLQNLTPVLGLTLHPPLRSKSSMEVVEGILEHLEGASSIPVWLENRSHERFLLSRADEIIAFSERHKMTIDIPQLYISSRFNTQFFFDTLNSINRENVVELHLANVRRIDAHTYVGRSLDDGELDISSVLRLFPSTQYRTLEVLGNFELNVSQAVPGYIMEV